MYPPPLTVPSNMNMNMGMGVPASAMGILASPAQSTASRWSDGSGNHGGALPFNHSPSISDFEIERAPRSSPAHPKRALIRRQQSEYDSEHALRNSVARLLGAKSRPFTVSGRIPLDPAALVLFFRSKVSQILPSISLYTFT